MSIPLLLRPLAFADEQAALGAHEAMVADDFKFLLGYEPKIEWAEYLQRLEDWRVGKNVASDWVPSTFLVADADGEIVGRVSIRHQLNEHLANVGGHIGYGVLSEHRRKGYATEILQQSLKVTKGLGIDRVLVTCDDDNIASAKTIERCGGVFDSLVDDGDGSAKRRYWIG